MMTDREYIAQLEERNKHLVYELNDTKHRLHKCQMKLDALLLQSAKVIKLLDEVMPHVFSK